MFFVVVKFTIRPERSAAWSSLVEDFTRATRAESGNLFFEWSRSVASPHEYVLVEGFANPEAGMAHMNSEHFNAVMAVLPDVIADTPEIISTQVEQEGWSPMTGVVPR